MTDVDGTAIRNDTIPSDIFAVHATNTRFSGGNWLGVHRPVNGVIRGNRFEKTRTAGLLVDPKETLTGPLVIERNTFVDNTGDGLRINVPIPLDITVRGNTSENNGQYGMWATPGTVTDGGRTSRTTTPSAVIPSPAAKVPR